MALFYKRPLACACACLIAVVFVGYFLSCLFSFLLACAFFIPFLILTGVCLFRGFSYRKLFAILVLAALSLGFLRVAIDRYHVQESLSEYQEKSVTAELVLKDVIYQNAYGTEFLAQVTHMNSKEESETVILRFDSTVPFGIEDRISGVFTVHGLEYEAYSEGAAHRYFSDGAKCLFVCEDMQTLSLSQSGTNTLWARLSRVRAVAAFRIADTVGGEEGNLLAAMLLGAKDKLSEATVRDFRLSGVSHLLALSGLHLMILVGLIDRILYLLRASKRMRIIIVMPLCLFYLILTGCNYSLLRAMLMLLAVYLSFLLREHNDSITTLFLCAAIILGVTPYAIFSLSFQMTMLATLGILAFTKLHASLYKILPAKKGLRDLPFKVLRAALCSILITLTTTLCLLPVLWLTVGSYSLMTPLANLLLVPIAPVLLFGALLALLLPFSITGSIIALVGEAALTACRFFASFDLMISLTRTYVPYILIPLFVASVLLLLIDLKKRHWLTLAPLAAAILAFSVVIPVSHQLGKESLEIAYRREGSNEGLILVQNSGAVLCDISNSSLTQWRADWYAAQQMGATQLEVLMLTHYHSKSVSALSRFSQSAYIHALWLPQPQTQGEREILLQLLEIAQKRGLSVTVYDHELALTVFEHGTLILQAPLFHSRSTEPAFSLEVTFAEKTLCYHTGALSEYLREQETAHNCKAAHLILGAHGPVPHGAVEIPQSDVLFTVLVGSEKVLSFLEMQQNLQYFAFPTQFNYILE